MISIYQLPINELFTKLQKLCVSKNLAEHSGPGFALLLRGGSCEIIAWPSCRITHLNLTF